MYANDGVAIGIIAIAGISTLIAIAAKIFLMLSVGSDMKARGLSNRALWMVLTFFIPISAVVYVVVRHWLPTEVPQYCESCHATVAAGAVQCACCGSGRLLPIVQVSPQAQKKKTKTFAIVGAVLYCLSAVLLTVSYAMILVSSFTYLEDWADDWMDFPDSYYGDNYEEDYDDFFEDFEEYGYGDVPFDFYEDGN